MARRTFDAQHDSLDCGAFAAAWPAISVCLCGCGCAHYAGWAAGRWLCCAVVHVLCCSRVCTEQSFARASEHCGARPVHRHACV